MASRKEYEMAFLLNATLNGGFKSTLSSAQQEFANLGKKIQEVSRVQSDISSYQKQQTAVNNTTEKLKNLNQQHDLLQKEIDETTGSTAGLEREKLKLEQRISDTEQALGRQTQKLDETDERLKAAGVDTSNLTGESERLGTELGDLRKKQDKAAEGAKTFGEKSAAAFQAAAEAIAAAGIADALGEIKDGFLECVNTAAGFEETMSTVQALSGATSSEMEELSDTAKEMGATTKFTAQESAEALTYMGMAGWDAQEMVSGLPGIINLAAASGEDLAGTSDIVTDALTAFGLTASDSAHFADVLAKAATSANTNVALMGETFQYAAPLAGALGYSVEDVATMIGLMANAGIKGSQSGTALRTMFTKLTDGATLTSESFGEVTVETQNSDGTMRTLCETISDLREYFGQMTQAEKLANAEALVGKYAMSGFVSLMNAADGDFQDLYQSITDCSGAAQEMADIRMDNMNGQLTLLQSAWEGLQTTVGEEFTPALEGLYSVATDVITAANDYVQTNPALLKAVTAGAGVFGTLATAIIGVNAAAKALKALNLASIFTGPVGAVLAVGTAVATLGVGIKSAVDEYWSLSDAAQELEDAIEDANGVFEDTSEDVEANALAADHYIDKLEALESAGITTDAQQKEYQNTLALLLQTMPELSDCISVTTDEYGRSTYALNTTTDALRENAAAIKEQAMAAAYQEQLTAVYGAYADAMVEHQKIEVQLTDAEERLTEAKEKRDAVQERVNTLTALGTKATADQRKELEQAKIDLTYWGNEVYNANNEVDRLNDNLEVSEGALADAEEQVSLTEQAFDAMTDAAEGLNDALDESDASSFQSELEGAKAALDEAKEAYDEVYKSALESFNGQFGLFEEAQANADTTIASLQAAQDSQLEYWTTYSSNIAALKDVSAEDLNMTQENYDAVMALVRDGSPEAAALADEMVKAIQDKDTEAIAKLGETMTETAKMREQSAEDVADWASGISEKADELVADFAEDVDSLNMDDEAESAARTTIQAYIDKANEMMPQVRAAYRAVASAASSALGQPSYSNSAYYANGNSQGLASGTDDALPGWTWVGENGPELIRMRGGEQVLPNQVSQEIAQAYQVYQKYGGDYAAEQEAQDNGAYAAALELMAKGMPPYFDGTISGYATGTDDAVPGWSWVGENGPELMRMKGGEQVLPNQASQEIARVYQEYGAYQTAAEQTGTRTAFSDGAGNGVGVSVTDTGGGFVFNINVAPVYQVSGNSDSVRDILEQNNAILKELILETVQDAVSDMKRRTFV